MVDKKTGLKPKAAKGKEVTGKKKPEVNTAKEKPIEEVVEKTEAAVSASKNTAEAAETESELAKAGKRSAKAKKEEEKKQLKEERKASSATDEAKPKQAKKPPRTRLERASKKYKEAAKLIEAEKFYPLADALELATKTSTTKFDATVELHINLGVDPTQADQNVRGMVSLPAGSGKTLRVAVFAEPGDAAKAKTAGADIVGNEELLASIDGGQIDFDILITTPSLMPKLGKYAKVLGPKGLMPNPKSGSITTDLVKAVTEAKAGRVEFRVDPSSIIHLGVGKVSFGKDKLVQNAEAVLAGIRAAKPASLKKPYIGSAFVSTTMGPSIKVELLS